MHFLDEMIQDWRFFTNFGAKTLETTRLRPTGSPQGRNGLEYRSRDARKRQTLRETLAGSPKTSDGARDNLREARKRETGRERLAGRPRERNSENDARGKPAERFLNV